MPTSSEQLLLQFTTPFYILIILFEIVWSNFQHNHYYTLKDTITNLYFMTLNSLIDVGFRVVSFSVLLFFFNVRFFQIQNQILYWFMLVILLDFLYYWLHRVDHYCRLFWAIHVTHHSSHQFNLTVGFRSSVFQPLYRFIWFIPLALFGFKVADIALVYAATQIWGILVHTKYIQKLGCLEYVLVTPSHHRVHHASNILYLDKNMGMLLIIWDKMFGTFQPEIDERQYEKIKYGLTTDVQNPNAINSVLHEFFAIANDVIYKKTTCINKLKYIFAPPGYSHDQSTLTSAELRAKYRKDNNAKASTH